MRCTRLPARGIARAQDDLLLFDQYELSGNHVDELFFPLAPMPDRGSGSGGNRSKQTPN